MASELTSGALELMPEDRSDVPAAELPREGATSADELERVARRRAIVELDERPGVVGRCGLLGDVLGLVPRCFRGRTLGEKRLDRSSRLARVGVRQPCSLGGDVAD